MQDILEVEPRILEADSFSGVRERGVPGEA